MQSTWHYRDDRYKYGPLTWEQLLSAARAGRLKPAHVVSKDQGKWVPAETIADLFSQAPEKTPPPKAETPESGKSGSAAPTEPSPTKKKVEPPPSARKQSEFAPTMEWEITSGSSIASSKDMGVPAGSAADSAPAAGSSDDYDIFEEPGSSAAGSSAPGATRMVRRLSEGSLLGNYEILETLGEGGMGTVLKARHVRMERLVALKVLRTQSTKPAGAIKRFHQEVKAASKLTHPNIVTAYDADEVNGVHFLVMEYVEGADLDELLEQRGGTLPYKEAVQFLLQAANGLSYAHSEGVVHRDVKPSNLMVDKRGSIKILDMGLASVKETTTNQARQEKSVHLTEAEQILGTFDYLPPEQAENARAADHRADIYALGCTLFRLVTGKAPYRGKTTIQKIFAHREHPIPTLSKHCPDVPFDLDSIFGKMVAKDPEMRYQSMKEVIIDLEACLESKPISAWQTGKWGGTASGESGIKLSDEKLRINPPSSDEGDDEYVLSPLGEEDSRKPKSAVQPRDTEAIKAEETKEVEPRWFWRVMGEEIGPLTLDELKEQNINTWDEVRREDNEQWVIAQDIDDLFG